jgi:hypothetical protein
VMLAFSPVEHRDDLIGEPTLSGLGRILILQAANEPSLSTWSSIEAMLLVGYIRIREVPCHWWQCAIPLPTSLDIGYLSVDYSLPFTPRGRHVSSLDGSEA